MSDSHQAAYDYVQKYVQPTERPRSQPRSQPDQFQALLDELQRTAGMWHRGVRNGAPLMHRTDAAARLDRLVAKYSRRVSESTTAPTSSTEET